MAALGALTLGNWRDAALVLACYATLVALHELIVRRSEEPLQALAAARATQATLAGSATPVPIKEVTVGDTIHVGKNDIVPLDGFVETGSTTVDQSIVTGSAAPVEKVRGSDIYAGSRNLGSDIEVRVARRPSQRTITRTAKLARTALPHHVPRAQQMLDELAGTYALGMLLIAAVAAFLLLLVIGDHSWRKQLDVCVPGRSASTSRRCSSRSPPPIVLPWPMASAMACSSVVRTSWRFWVPSKPSLSIKPAPSSRPTSCCRSGELQYRLDR